MTTLAFQIEGMDCAEEVATLRAELAPMPGISELAFDILNRKLQVTLDESRVSAEAVINAITRTGMRAAPWKETGAITDEASVLSRWGRTLLTTSSGLLLASGLLVHMTRSGN